MGQALERACDTCDTKQKRSDVACLFPRLENGVSMAEALERACDTCITKQEPSNVAWLFTRLENGFY